VDAYLTSFTARPEYSLGLALMEASAALHMLPRRGAVYHAVRGDIDLCILPRAARRTGNYAVASFHEVPDAIGYYLDGPRVAEQLHAAILLGECQRPYFDLHLPAERIFVVHHSVDTEFFRPAPSLPADPVCITVGAHMRDPETLTAAMKLVWQSNPRVRLIAIGTARPGYVQAAPALQDERVTLMDRVTDPELLRAYHSARVALLCVRDAVANNALLEHMACGLPVVGSDVGAVGEYLGDEAGVLFPRGDAEAMADAVLRLCDDQPACARMGAAARARALALDHRVAARRLMDVYRRVEALG
jgi:glycosyltransferase involved in cell wall biosynthesis